MNKKSVITGIIVVLILILVTVFNNDSKLNNLSEESITIVALYPLTGGLASWGESAQKASQIAIDEINDNGGINGRKLEVVFEDHKCDPKTALSIYKRYSSTNKIFTSSSCSGTVLSIAPSLEQDQAILLSTVVASTKITNASPMLFRNWTIESNQSEAIAQDIKNNEYKKVGILYEETDYARGLKDSLEKLLGPEVAFISEGFVTGSGDLRTQISKIQSSNVDVLFLSPQTESSSEVILSQMEQLDFKPTILVNDIILGAKDLILNHKTLLENAKGAQYITKESKKLSNLLDKYREKYGSECSHSGACAVAYDTMHILSEAISENGESAQGIKDYLETINYKGADGITSFNEFNDRSNASYSGVIIKDGEVVSD